MRLSGLSTYSFDYVLRTQQLLTQVICHPRLSKVNALYFTTAFNVKILRQTCDTFNLDFQVSSLDSSSNVVFLFLPHRWPKVVAHRASATRYPIIRISYVTTLCILAMKTRYLYLRITKRKAHLARCLQSLAKNAHCTALVCDLRGSALAFCAIKWYARTLQVD